MGSDGSMNNDTLTSKETKKSFSDVTAEVFGNPLLLSKILVNFIFHENKTVSRNGVKVARLINKFWLETTNNSLMNSVRPAIVITLDANNSRNESDEVQLKGKRWDQFIAQFGSTGQLVNSFLPFQLNLKLEYFCAENQQSLIDCLTNFGNELVELQIDFTNNGGSMPLLFPSFRLPFLKRLTFRFTIKNSQYWDFQKHDFGNNTNGLWLLQSILNASENIKYLVFLMRRNVDVVPSDLDFLRLPTSISTFKFYSPWRSRHLEILINNQLPNLKYLKLEFHPNKQSEYDTVSKILDRFQNTLTTLTLLVIGYKLSRFPLMKNLKTLYIRGVNIEPEPSDDSQLQTFFPKLESLNLSKQTDVLVGKWIQGSEFNSVKQLTLCNITDELQRTDPNYISSISLERIEQVYFAFPNLHELFLAFNPSDLNCLTYVFKTMQNLNRLTIKLCGSSGEVNNYSFDSMLLGLPLEVVKVLAEHSSLDDLVQLNQNKELSILHLSELTRLSLYNTELPEVPGLIRPENDKTSLLTNLLFNEALLKMPKLTRINFSGKFQVSSEMKQMWYSQRGRLIAYSRPE